MERQSRDGASLVNGVFEHQVNYLSTQARAIADSKMVRQSLADIGRFNREQSLPQVFPYVLKAYLFKQGAIKLQMDNGEKLSFASLDMLKRTARGEMIQPEAFLVDGQWYIQIARAVKDQSGEIQGLILLMYSPELFSDLLQGVKGKASLIQVQGDYEKAFVEQGRGEGATYTFNSSTVKAWKLAYQLPYSGSFFDHTLYWGVMIACSLFVALVVFLIIRRLLGKVQKDVIDVTQFANNLLSGERTRVPEFIFGNFYVMARNLERTSKTADVKARELQKGAARKKGQSAAASALSGKGAAHFGGADLNVGVIEEDEDILGMGGTDDATAIPDSDRSGSDSEALFGDDDLLSDTALDNDVLAEEAGLLEEAELVDPDGVLMDESLFDEAFDEGLGIAETEPVDAPGSVFRAYDIRGIVGQELTPGLTVSIGRAIGSEANARGQNTVVVGYDGRLSSPELAESLVTGLVSSGVRVIEVGQVPTPVLYFATCQLGTGSGVMVTGSHNPPEYNGFKMVLGGETLAGEEIQKLYQRIVVQDYQTGQGSRERQDISRDYMDAILNDIAVAAPLRIVIDAGNGVAGELAPVIIEELGCEVIPLHCEVDGNFPNHHPDPGKRENLVDLIEAVKHEDADLGIAFDGDGDRLGVVTNEGKIIWPDRLLMLFAKDVVSRNPGADIIFDVKCSRRLSALVSEYGGRPVMWKTGHSLIKSKMKETGALLAGEMSGHVFFKERWFGFDDAIYSAARLLEILGLDERPAHAIFDSFPEDISTPEINVEVTEESKFTIVSALSSTGQFGDGNITDIDGIRVDYADGWGLCRASNTTPTLVLRFEANDEAALKRIQTVFREQLLRVDATLDIPF
ncbi:MAG: phosphomannomutase [Gammaproteobacteria bacterium]|nr:MAG: phosphomannomutase [Pseudomonadota bacterium]PIE38459.1 MAG: phosphomannomutase [Gammaproteobacteria bacterium]